MEYSILRKAIGPDSDIGVYYEKADGNHNVILDFKDNIAKIPDNVLDQDDFVLYLQQYCSQFFSVVEMVEEHKGISVLEETTYVYEIEDKSEDTLIPLAEESEVISESIIEVVESDVDNNTSLWLEDDLEDEEDEDDSDREDVVDPISNAIIKAETMDEVLNLLIQAGCALDEDILFAKLQELRDTGLIKVLVGKQNGILKLSVIRVLKKRKS